MSKFWFDTDNLVCYQVNITKTHKSGDRAYVHDSDMPESHDYVVPLDWLKDNELDAIEARKDCLAHEYEYKRQRLEDIRQWMYRHEKIVDRLVRRKASEQPRPISLEQSGIFGGIPPTNSNIDFIPDPTEGRF
jgi:hypothetical protein